MPNQNHQSTPLIQFFHVCKRSTRSHPVLNDVTIQIDKGDLALLAGPNGSGKTTLLKIIMGLDTFQDGRVLFEGQSLTEILRRGKAFFRRRIGYISQEFRLLDEKSAFHNVALPLLIRGLDSRLIQKRAYQLLLRMELGSRMDTPCGQLSSGEKQEVAFARALCANPDLILADEPLEGLDAARAERMIHLLKEAHTAGKTVVIAANQSRFEELTFSRVFQVRRGRVEEAAHRLLDFHERIADNGVYGQVK